MKTIIAFLLCTSALVKIHSQISVNDTLVFEWTTELCYHTGYYLPSQYTEEEIKNTYNLLNKSSIVLDATSVYTPDDIPKIDIAALTTSYEEIMEFYYNYQPVDVPFWKRYLEACKAEAEKDYYLKKLQLEAYTNPAVLLTNKYKYEDCQKYAEAVASKDEDLLLATWKQFAEDSSKKNGNPEWYMDRFYRRYYSTDNLLYARVDLITFGWWNCMNHHMSRADYGMLEREFDKLFTRIDSECDEP